MAETAKILAPEKKVLLPDMNAGCSLADSCKAEDFRRFIEKNPGRTVITYVNTTAEIKALSDICCTSSNAVEIVNSLPAGEKIIFAPDRNLGNYVINKTGKDIVVWNGTCHVHEEFSLEAIIRLKENNPEAKIIVHPECELPVRMIADFIGSTSALLQFTQKDNARCYIIATEPGIIHQMKKYMPEKEYIPAPPRDSTCGCSECNFMKLITVKKIYECLKNEKPETSRRKAQQTKSGRDKSTNGRKQRNNFFPRFPGGKKKCLLCGKRFETTRSNKRRCSAISSKSKWQRKNHRWINIIIKGIF